MAVIHILENKMKYKKLTAIYKPIKYTRYFEYCYLCKEKIAEHDEKPFGWSKAKQRHNCKEWTEITNNKKETETYE